MAELNIGLDMNGSVVIGRIVDGESIIPIIVFPNIPRAREFANNMMEFLIEKEYPVPRVYLKSFNEEIEDNGYDIS